LAGPAFPAVPPAPVVLAETMLRVLRWLSPGRGAILVLEDMHRADRETLGVLAYLADHVAAFPVAVVLTARSDEPGSSGLGSALTRDPLYLHLAPLADSQVAAMAAACLGVDTAPEAILAGLRRNAASLPLLVEDLIGVAGHPGPLRYAEIISGRLARLDAAACGVVEAAAILGTEADPGLLGQVSGLAPSAVADAITPSKSLTPGPGQAVAVITAARTLPVMELRPGLKDVRRPAALMHAYIVLSLLAGIRTEEARALRWSHVNLDGNPAARPPVPPHVAVWRSVRVHGETKTERSRRTLGLPAVAVQALRAWSGSQAGERLAAGDGWQDPGWCSPPTWAPRWTRETSGRCSNGSAPRPGSGTAEPRASCGPRSSTC
jgi:hypothetical protein